jgi:type IV pilus assembly protein PilO
MKGMGLLTASVLMIVVGMPVAAYFVVFRPQNAEIKRVNDELAHKQTLLAKLQAETARNADLVRANDDIKKSITMIEERLPTNQEIDGLVRQVSDLAVQSGMGSPAIKTNRAQPAGLYKEQPIDMQLMGDFNGFFNFLRALERLPRITRVHDLKLTANLDDTATMQAEFTLSIYFQETPEDAN